MNSKRSNNSSGSGYVLWAVMALVVSLTASGSSLSADVEGYRFIIEDIETRPGREITLTVLGEYEQSAQGFTMAARYPSEDLTLLDFHVKDTILEAINIDFFDFKDDPDEGYFVVGALIDSAPPFDGNLIPNVSFALDLFHIETRVAAHAQGNLSITLEDALSVPPAVNSYTVDNQTISVTELQGGTIVLPIRPPPTRHGDPVFIRGDSNLSAQVDISDPVFILEAIFLGKGALRCEQAADANDDEQVDIADAIYVLKFLFRGGGPPLPPFGRPGKDPTQGALGCAKGLSSL